MSAETYLPVSVTIGASTYRYDRIERLPDREDLLGPTLRARRATVCVQTRESGPACSVRRWP